MPDNCTMLPDGYKRTENIDLQNNKRTALFVNFLGIVLFVVLLVPLFFITGVPSLFRRMVTDASTESLIATVILCAGIFVYMVLHEITHGIFMKIFGKAKVKLGFTGLYAYAGSMAYFNKRSYIITALAPLVIWSIIFIPLALHSYLFYSVYFHVFYILEVINISGSAGDMYMAVKISRMNRNVLVNDSGTNMTVYSTHVGTYE